MKGDFKTHVYHDLKDLLFLYNPSKAEEELEEIIAERGAIDVNCEFCGARYTYDPVDVAALEQDRTTGSNTVH